MIGTRCFTCGRLFATSCPGPSAKRGAAASTEIIYVEFLHFYYTCTVLFIEPWWQWVVGGSPLNQLIDYANYSYSITIIFLQANWKCLSVCEKNNTDRKLWSTPPWFKSHHKLTQCCLLWSPHNNRPPLNWHLYSGRSVYPPEKCTTISIHPETWWPVDVEKEEATTIIFLFCTYYSCTATHVAPQT